MGGRWLAGLRGDCPVPFPAASELRDFNSYDAPGFTKTRGAGSWAGRISRVPRIGARGSAMQAIPPTRSGRLLCRVLYAAAGGGGHACPGGHTGRRARRAALPASCGRSAARRTHLPVHYLDKQPPVRAREIVTTRVAQIWMSPVNQFWMSLDTQFSPLGGNPLHHRPPKARQLHPTSTKLSAGRGNIFRGSAGANAPVLHPSGLTAVATRLRVAPHPSGLSRLRIEPRRNSAAVTAWSGHRDPASCVGIGSPARSIAGPISRRDAPPPGRTPPSRQSTRCMQPFAAAGPGHFISGPFHSESVWC